MLFVFISIPINASLDGYSVLYLFINGIVMYFSCYTSQGVYAFVDMLQIQMKKVFSWCICLFNRQVKDLHIVVLNYLYCIVACQNQSIETN